MCRAFASRTTGSFDTYLERAGRRGGQHYARLLNINPSQQASRFRVRLKRDRVGEFVRLWEWVVLKVAGEWKRVDPAGSGTSAALVVVLG